MVGEDRREDNTQAARYGHKSIKVDFEPRGIPVSTFGDKADYDPINAFRLLLAHEDISIKASGIRDSRFGNLEGLVAKVDFTKHIEELPYFQNHGFLVLPTEKGKIVLIRDCQDGKPDVLRDAYEVKESISDYRSNQGLAENTPYLIISDSQFKQMIQFCSDPNALREFTNIVSVTDPVEVILENILLSAMKQWASDIHIDPQEKGRTDVRYRVDGVLQKQTQYDDMPLETISRVTSALKVKARLDPGASHMPLDSSIKFTELDLEKHPDFAGKSLRFSSSPTIYDDREKVNLRILDSSSKRLDLSQLGFSETLYKRLTKQVSSPHGLFLVTGQTGSGKSTTLYSLLRFLNDPSINIMTAEDPVEIAIQGVTQVSVDLDRGRDYTAILRGFLRQDPDVILVGEIRDPESAKLAMRAANTGHYVLSTLHTRSAVEAISKLYDLGIDKSDMQASLNGVLAQVLVRKLCQDCKTSHDATKTLNELLGGVEIGSFYEYSSTGTIDGRPCVSCDSNGYRGRIAVPELWILTDKERKLIYSGNRNIEQYRKLAVKNGMNTLAVEGILKVTQRVTTLNEISREISADGFVRSREQIIKVVDEYRVKDGPGVKV